jgi:hypothetical protein
MLGKVVSIFSKNSNLLFSNFWIKSNSTALETSLGIETKELIEKFR